MRQSFTLVLAALVVSFASCRAQSATITGNTGPGGVGATNVASNLNYWLEADAIAGSNGSPVAAWNDTRTFSPNNFTQANATQQPTLVTSGINGLPSVSFDAAALPNHDKLVLSTPTTPRSIFIVNQVAIGQPGSCCVGLFGADGIDFGIRREGSDTSTWRGTFAQTPAYTVASDYGFAAGSQMFINGRNTAAAAEGVNHILFASTPSLGAFSTTSLGDYFSTSGSRRWKGLVGEVISFDVVLSATQRVLVENYLGAKFAIPLDTANGALDVYSGDNSGTDYDHDVFGIGNDGTTSVQSSGSHGFGIEEQNASLGAGEWVLAGHADPTNSILGDIEGPATGERWSRVWYVDTNGGSVDARLAFDFDDADLASEFSADDYFTLLYSANSGLAWQPLANTALVDAGNKLVMFDLAALESGFYTLAINAQFVPEPSTFGLLAIGAVGLTTRRRARKSLS